MLGRDDDYVNGLERAHHAYMDACESSQAARCAWWIGHHLLFRGETAPASGWFARAQGCSSADRATALNADTC